MTQKQFYESPSAELLVVRFEENILLSGGKTGEAGKAGAVWTSGDDFTDYGDL